MEWSALAEREEARYADGLRRLPNAPDARQKQLVRMAMAAGGAGLARLMEGRSDEASAWFGRSAERYRESWEAAPPESWGRLAGAVKARLLAGDWAGARADAEWALGEVTPEASAIGRYAATLAALVLEDDDRATGLAASLRDEDPAAFPRSVAAALAALAARDGPAYAVAAREVLRSFEERDAYLEDVPVADTVLVLEALAAKRGIAANVRSQLLPG